MPQFFVPPDRISGSSYSLDPEESHHLFRVHRAQPGDVIQLFDGAGRRFRARIDSAIRSEVSGVLLQEIPEVLPRFRLFLHIAALPRAKHEEIIEKGTELGVSGFQVVTTSRAVVKASDTDGRMERLG